MTVFKEFKVGGNNNPLGSFGPVIFLILGFVALYFVAKAAFTILGYLTPVLLILALVIDYTVVTDYIKFLWKLLRDNTLYGIVGVLLTFLGLPVVSGFLAARAYLRKKTKTIIKEKEESKYADYEEVTDDDEDFLTLPEQPTIVKTKAKDSNNEYNDLFE